MGMRKGGWQDSTYTGGRMVSIAGLVKAGTHSLEVWGNGVTGWTMYLVSAEMPTVGVAVSPVFHKDYGDTKQYLEEAARRSYGLDSMHRFKHLPQAM